MPGLPNWPEPHFPSGLPLCPACHTFGSLLFMLPLPTMPSPPWLPDLLANVDMYVPNNRGSEYRRQNLIELQGVMGLSSVVVGGNHALCQKWTEPSGRKLQIQNRIQQHHQPTGCK